MISRLFCLSLQDIKTSNNKNMAKIKDLTGKKFGKLTAISHEGYSKWGNAMWVCRCDCGNEKIVSSHNLKPSKTLSCGCSRRQDGESTAFNALRNGYRASARIRGYSFDIKSSDFKKLVDGDCAYCGIKPSMVKQVPSKTGTYTYNGIDRVNNHLGYTITNCVPCCGQCNKAKGTMSYDEFMSWITRIIKYTQKRQD